MHTTSHPGSENCWAPCVHGVRVENKKIKITVNLLFSLDSLEPLDNISCNNRSDFTQGLPVWTAALLSMIITLSYEHLQGYLAHKKTPTSLAPH